MAHLSSLSQFKLDGTTIVDGAAVNRLAPAEYRRNHGQGHGITKFVNGNSAVVYALGSSETRRGPVGNDLRSWEIEIPFADDVFWPLYLRHTLRPVTHTYHDKVLDAQHFDGNGSELNFYLSRQVLGVGYSQAGGLGVNSGLAELLRVYRLDTGAAYTVVDAAPGAGEVQLIRVGTYAYRNLLFNAAPPNTQGVIYVEAYFLYRVAVNAPYVMVRRNGNGEYAATVLPIRELGEAA